MSKRFPILIFFAFALLARLFIVWAVGDGFESRDIWAPVVYSVAVAGLILSSLIAVGIKDSNRALAAAFIVWFFQWIALGAVVLREPGHALAAERLHCLFGIPAFTALFLLKDRDGLFPKGICVIALLTIGAAPPLPGFFAHIELLSAISHGKLPQLAALTAFSQICLFFVASKEIFRDSKDHIADNPAVAEKQ